MKKVLNRVADFLLDNFIRLYIIALLVIVIICAKSCMESNEVVAEAKNQGFEIYYEKPVEQEQVKVIKLNTCSQSDVQSEGLGRKVPVTYLDEIPLSSDLQKYIFKTCDKYSISPYLIFAIIERESKFDIAARGDHGESYGLMQIKKKYQKERMKRLKITNLQDPYSNVLVGIDYVHELFEEHEDIAYVLHCYNGGQAYANKLYKKGKTSKYAKAVMARAEELEKGSENIETTKTK